LVGQALLLYRLQINIFDCYVFLPILFQTPCDKVADSSADQPAAKDARNHIGKQDGSFQAYGCIGKSLNNKSLK
jgi:hypothetical protein